MLACHQVLSYENRLNYTIQCKRVNVGGKLLTNYLKEIISYRQLNMMDEFKLMDQVIIHYYIY
jgi:hypothetical protein